jgi:hypothetical protein
VKDSTVKGYARKLRRNAQDCLLHANVLPFPVKNREAVLGDIGGFAYNRIGTIAAAEQLETALRQWVEERREWQGRE